MTEAEPRSKSDPISILYIDDEKDFLVLGKILLERTGEFSVRTMTSALEALRSSHTHSYDVIVSDYMMPGMDGITFLKKVREQFGDIPFILFTGHGHENVVIEAINNSADYYLQKDGDPLLLFVDLSEKIRQAVRKKRPNQSVLDSEKYLFDIIDFIPDATFAIDQSGEVIAWNRAIEEMTGVSFRDMLGKGNFEYSVPFYGIRRPLLIDLIDEPIEKIEEYYVNVHWAGNSLIGETDLPNPKGHHISALIKVCRHYNTAGEIIGAIELIQDITELKRTEQELRRSQERLLNLTKRSSDRIHTLFKNQRLLTDVMDLANLVNWEYDVIKDIFSFDNRFYAMYGTSAECEGGNQMTSETYAREFVHPGDRHLVAEEIEKVITANDSNFVSQLEHRIVRRDGEIRYITVRFGLIKDEEGRTIKTYGANQDITDRKKTELALQKSENRFNAVTINAGSWIWEVDTEGIYRYSSPIIERILGYKPDELIGKLHFYDLFDPSIREEQKANAMKAFGSESPFCNFINLNRYKDGSTVILKTSGTPVFDEDGKFSGYSGVDEDITEQIRKDEELRANEEKFRSIVESSPGGMYFFSLDSDDRFILTGTNPATDIITGIKNQELLGSTIEETFPSLINTDIPVLFRKVAAGELGPQSMEIPFRDNRFNGFYAFTAFKIGIQSIALHFNDITNRKKAELALQQANRQVNLLTSITRHDILNNVSVILTYLDAAKIGCKDPAILDCFQNIELATTVIQSQIEFTRVYQDLGILKPQWQDLEPILPKSDLLTSFKLPADVKGISIFADPMLQKVFLNLLDNSVRHGHHVTEIQVSASESGNELLLIWEDNGNGIADADKEIIFERGFGKNTGLGMFLVREILSLTGITITETGVFGKGACFEITVPKGGWRKK